MEQSRDLVAHVPRAGDHALGSVSEPVLDRVDRVRQVGGQPALVAPRLGGVEGGDEGCLAPRRRGQGGGSVGHHPIVSVHDLGRAFIDDRKPASGNRALHAHHPREQVGGIEGHRGRIVRDAHDPHTVHSLVVGRIGRGLCQHDDVIAPGRLSLGERVHMSTEAAVDQRRVLP